MWATVLLCYRHQTMRCPGSSGKSQQGTQPGAMAVLPETSTQGSRGPLSPHCMQESHWFLMLFMPSPLFLFSKQKWIQLQQMKHDGVSWEMFCCSSYKRQMLMVPSYLHPQSFCFKIMSSHSQTMSQRSREIQKKTNSDIILGLPKSLKMSTS